MSEEAQLYSLPRILAEDFAEFAAMLVNDEDFSSSHAAWERLASLGWLGIEPPAPVLFES